MHSYHVYFNAKPGTSTDSLVAQVHLFMKLQIQENFAIKYRLFHFTSKISFPEMPDFHLTVDYASEETLQKAFTIMKGVFQKAPHLNLMQMVDGFRVAFSQDK